MRIEHVSRFTVIGILFWLVQSSISAQAPDFPEVVAESDAQVSARRLQRVFESAQQVLSRNDINNALPLLQSILDQPQDTLYFPDPADRQQAVSLKGLVLDTLSGLPATALESYDLLYGSKADELLGLAESGDELAALEEVVRRYYHTTTGRASAVRLARTYFDRGNFLSAALTFERLLDSNVLDEQARSSALWQSAIAWSQMGYFDKSTASLEKLRQSAGDKGLRIGSRRVDFYNDPATAQTWLARVTGIEQQRQTESNLFDWKMFRGNSSRTAGSSPSPPIREADWDFRTIPLSEADDPRQLELVERELHRIATEFEPTSYLTIPAAHPLVVDERIVIRSLGNLKAIDLRSGELLWETFKIDSAFTDLLNKGTDAFNSHDAQISDFQRFLMQRTWRDVTVGTLSSDGQRVYAIEEQKILRPSHNYANRVPGIEKDTSNELAAYDLQSGKEVWSLGGDASRQMEWLNDAVFLGTPLVQGSELFCMIELNDEILLLALQNREVEAGKIEPVLLWSQPLPIPVATEYGGGNPFGQLAGLSPSYADGILICPTAHGTVVGYDLARKLLKWRYQYSDGPAINRQTGSELNQMQNTFGVGPEDEHRWLDSAPTIVKGRVLLTPCDSNRLHCIDLMSGELVWTRPRGDDLYLACAEPDRVVLVGREQARGVSLETGSEIWSSTIPEPSGRGFQAGNTYTIPLSTGEMLTLDVADGSMRAIAPLESGRVAGNLVSVGGTVITQTSDRVFRFRSMATLEDQIEEEPNLAESQAIRAELKLYEEGLSPAIASLLSVNDSHPSERIETILRRMMIERLMANPGEFSAYLSPLETLTRGTPYETQYRELLAEHLANEGELDKAFRTYLELAQQPLHQIERRKYLARSDAWVRAKLVELLTALTATPSRTPS